MPKVSIGLPVFNGERHLESVLISILDQSFSDFEIIISDNASTDRTYDICQKFLLLDSRVRYYRHETTLGATGNFKFVLDQARGRYYMWAADDDIRTRDFLLQNVAALDTNNNYVASTCPNCFEGQEHNPSLYVTFSMAGGLEERYKAFLDNCWLSHGIFYSLMRTDIIRACPIVDESFTAVDWAIIFFMASRGEINRTSSGLAIFGRDGVSNRADAWRVFRTRPVEIIFPLYQFSRYALRYMKPLSASEWWRVFKILAYQNIKASYSQFRAEVRLIRAKFFGLGLS